MRLDLLTRLRRFERDIRQLALIGDFDRTPRDARVTRLAGELQVRLRRERVVAPLQSDLAQEELVERRLVQALGIVGPDRFRAIGLSARDASQCECQRSEYKGEKPTDEHLDSTDLRYIWCPAQATPACLNSRK